MREVVQGVAVAGAAALFVGDKAAEVVREALQFLRVGIGKFVAPAFLQLPDFVSHGPERLQAPSNGDNLHADHQHGNEAQPDVQALPERLNSGEKGGLVGRHLEGEPGLIRLLPDHGICQDEPRRGGIQGEQKLTDRGIEFRKFDRGRQRRRRPPTECATGM